ncbi:aminodeoxychorismate synthase component I [uncultured Umboniibacter sp.]|uniref:aminodeoxychorismate synthase component I n=1 Tax=uncultured Umboniibacter sp. TaxID=1798917 RepID=UPI0026365018|nr:aminodeoxychorismate synthase component I [uncultured Umboniibacter sp.]
MSPLELPYFEDATNWFELLTPLGQPVLLDGASHSRANHDIIAAAPSAKLVLWDEHLELTMGKTITRQTTSNFFSVLRSLHATNAGRSFKSDTLSGPDIPFSQGLIGYIGYDINQVLGSVVPLVGKAQPRLPIAFVSRYDWAVVQCHRSRRAWFTGDDLVLHQKLISLAAQVSEESVTTPTIPSFTEEGIKWTAATSPLKYQKAINRIHEYIDSGDCYQVNYTQRFTARYTQPALAIYKRVKASVQSPFNALLPVGLDQAVISVSPERLVQLTNGVITTQPIKGTMPRYDDPIADEESRTTLVESEKDRAENLMIVDLLRNDIGRVAQPSTVEVSKLFDIEPYANVYHLVSTIKAKLDQRYDAIDLLEATLPGGSITGAPKIRAMEIIEELETARRSAYCGTIFYLDASGDLDSNVAIRTLVKDNDKLHIWGGGGIVADSDADAEQAESRNKIRAFVNALGGTLEYDDDLEDR